MEAQNHTPRNMKILVSVLIVIALACIVMVAVMWNKLGEVQAQIPVDTEVELQETIAAIGAYLTLPQDEKPTLFTLTDEQLSSVRGEAFFTNALPGDKLLLYQNNSRAVIWRPSSEKIIEASIIDLTAPTAAP